MTSNSIQADFHEAWTGRGVALWNLKQYQEAIASYDKRFKLSLTTN
jgi:tetratricopeptide (TPR) repeat protein